MTIQVGKDYNLQMRFWKNKHHLILFVVSTGTGLSLLGDTTLYTVLPTHTAEAGVMLASVGILLSANRWIRLPLNGIAGVLLEKVRRRPIFVLSLFLGAFSTWMYAMDSGFWPLLLARIIWGISWVGIWVGGNTMILDISTDQNRGRRIGIYQVAFFTGAGGGALIGGVLTDTLGYHNAMTINALVTLIGALIAWAFLPETRAEQPDRHPSEMRPEDLKGEAQKLNPRFELASATALMASSRLVQEGILLATMALYLSETLEGTIGIGNLRLGTATLTGLSLGFTTLIAAVAAPLSGGLSDKIKSRWKVAFFSLIPGVLGFILLQTGTPAWILIGLTGTSFASSSSMNLSTALIGDLGTQGQHSRRLGGLFTVGDLASAVGPPLAFALQPLMGITGIYWLTAGVFAWMAILALIWVRVHLTRQKKYTQGIPGD